MQNENWSVNVNNATFLWVLLIIFVASIDASFSLDCFFIHSPYLLLLCFSALLSSVAHNFLWRWTWFSFVDCFACIHLFKWFIWNCHSLTRSLHEILFTIYETVHNFLSFICFFLLISLILCMCLFHPFRSYFQLSVFSFWYITFNFVYLVWLCVIQQFIHAFSHFIILYHLTSLLLRALNFYYIWIFYLAN